MTRDQREVQLRQFDRKLILQIWRRALGHHAATVPPIGTFVGQMIVEILNEEFPPLDPPRMG
jgi:hypothetical protein